MPFYRKAILNCETLYIPTILAYFVNYYELFHKFYFHLYAKNVSEICLLHTSWQSAVILTCLWWATHIRTFADKPN